MMLSLIKSYLSDENLSDDVKEEIASCDLILLSELSKTHYVLPLVSESLYRNDILDKNEKSEFADSLFTSVRQYQIQTRDQIVISAIFEKNNIPHIFLKGMRIRELWKDAYLRTASDIDVLVKKEDIEKAETAFLKNGFTLHEKTEKDISFFTKIGTFVELHFSISESGMADSTNAVLDRVWDYSEVKNGTEYKMHEEMFYFHHIAHMAKHFEEGGCGLRPIIDLYVLLDKVSYDKEKLEALLESGGLLKFDGYAKKLSDYWFKGGEKDSFIKLLESYILLGGAFGTMENTVNLQKQKKGGERYILEKIFLPYDIIKFQYPVLQKHRWLTPFYEVRRWFKLLFKGGIDRSVKEIKTNAKVTEKAVNSAEEMLRKLGLK